MERLLVGLVTGYSVILEDGSPTMVFGGVKARLALRNKVEIIVSLNLQSVLLFW